MAATRAVRLPSFAKVNLGLEVLGLREDGYHELRTLFQAIDLADDVLLRDRDDGEVTVECDHPAVPRDETNLAVRAARALQRYTGTGRGVDIVLRKRIPVAGGLGGGSSNAAATLLGLVRLWRLDPGPDDLHRIAARLGADVPFFLVGGTALGLGRGDEVYPLHAQVEGHVVVVDPQRALSTAAVFRRVDAGLTPREGTRTLFRFVSRTLDGRGDAFPILANDLERAALEEAPELGRLVGDIRGILVREGARLALLSGSGAAFFGLFDSAERARRAHAALAAGGFRTARSRTLSLHQYRRRLSPRTGTTATLGFGPGRERTPWKSQT